MTSATSETGEKMDQNEGYGAWNMPDPPQDILIAQGPRPDVFLIDECGELT